MQTAHASYPVTLDVHAPELFQRTQLLVRVLVAVALGALFDAFGGLFGALYFFLPLVAAILISRRGGEGYITRDSRWLVAMLEWVIGLYAYLLLVTDRFPLDASTRPARISVQTGGEPSVGRALLRLVTSIPHAIVLTLLGIVSAIVWIVAMIAILFEQRYPKRLYAFQHHLVAYTARLLAYHASLVEPYPPFSLAEGHASEPPSGAGAHFA